MKKITSLVVLLLSLLLVACGGDDKKPDPKPDPDPVEEENMYLEYSLEQLRKINEHLRVDSNHLFHANKLEHTVGGGVANLWDYSAYFTAVIKTYKVVRTEEVKALFNQAMDDLEWYRSTNRNDDHLVYASDNGREKPAFYDDNVWLVIGFLEAYEFTNEPSYLEKAEKIQAWIYESWQEADGGGLLWREFAPGTEAKDISRNTCINAPAAYAAARFYQITKDESHLAWAKKIFDWTKEVLYDEVLDVYLDNVNQLGTVSDMKFTYNSGVMISASSLLYELTKDNAYQAHAIEVIEGAKAIFSYKSLDSRVTADFYQDNTWFRMYLFQGYLDAFRYLDDKTTVIEYMDKAIEGFEVTYPRYKDYYGLALYEWDGRSMRQAQSEDFKAASLYASGNLESMTVFAEYINEKMVK